MSLDLHDLPAWPQSQESVTDQLASLVLIANRLGLYDAADAVKQMSGNIPQLKYGCHKGPQGRHKWPDYFSRRQRRNHAGELCLTAGIYGPLQSRLCRDAEEGMPLQDIYDLIATELEANQ